MGKRVGAFSTINIHFDTTREEQRAFEIIESVGIQIPARIRSGDCFREWPQTTHLMHVQFNNERLDYCPQSFICAAMVSSGARLVTLPELERIAELDFRVEPRFPVFHIPHDGQAFPYPLMTEVCVPPEDFMEYHEAMRDKDVSGMIPMPYVGQMRRSFGISRLLCDVERLIGPEEIMERYGMGFCYEKAYDGRVIKRVTEHTKALARVLRRASPPYEPAVRKA